jgi:hypothetical protein
LREISSEQDQIQRPGLLVELAKIAFERRLNPGQQQIQLTLPLVKICDMQPRERHGSSHRGQLYALPSPVTFAARLSTARAWHHGGFHDRCMRHVSLLAERARR